MSNTTDNPTWWWNNDEMWQELLGMDAKDAQAMLGITEAITAEEEVTTDVSNHDDVPTGDTFPVRSVNDINYLNDVYRYNGMDYRLKWRYFLSLRNFFDNQLKWSEFTPVVTIKYAEVDYVYHVLPGDLLIRYESFMPNLVGFVESVPEITIDERTEYKDAVIKVHFPRFPAIGEIVIGDVFDMGLDKLKAAKFTYVIRSTMASAGNLYRTGYETDVRGILPP